MIPSGLPNTNERYRLAHVARQVHRLRTEAGLSQRQMAAKVGTTASVICRLEDAEYEGHSLSMLRRVAAAVNKRVVITFEPLGAVPSRGTPAAARKAAVVKKAFKATAPKKATKIVAPKKAARSSKVKAGT